MRTQNWKLWKSLTETTKREFENVCKNKEKSGCRKATEENLRKNEWGINKKCVLRSKKIFGEVDVVKANRGKRCRILKTLANDIAKSKQTTTFGKKNSETEKEWNKNNKTKTQRKSKKKKTLKEKKRVKHEKERQKERWRNVTVTMTL